MIKQTIIKNISIGDGSPKVCIPLTPTSDEDVIKELNTVINLEYDILEWRIDYYYFYLSSDHLKYNTRIIKNAIGDHPLMVTLRTKGEGGKAALGYAEYFNILEAIIEDGVIDIIDLQVKMPEAFLSKVIRKAQQKDIKVLLSYHNLKEMPTNDKIIDLYQKMNNLNADICKVALMPQDSEEVEQLRNTTSQFINENDTKPIVAIALGELGSQSRLESDSIIYACIDNPIAPGQVNIKEVREYLKYK